MKLIFGLLEYPKDVPAGNIYMFTANDTLNKNGELVMGAGNALAFKRAYPDAPKRFGYLVSTQPKPINVISYSKGGIASFRTKQAYWKPSTLELVKESTEVLLEKALQSPSWTYHLPYPAVGLGGLTITEVGPLVDTLPDNVHVYLYTPK